MSAQIHGELGHMWQELSPQCQQHQRAFGGLQCHNVTNSTNNQVHQPEIELFPHIMLNYKGSKTQENVDCVGLCSFA